VLASTSANPCDHPDFVKLISFKEENMPEFSDQRITLFRNVVKAWGGLFPLLVLTIAGCTGTNDSQGPASGGTVDPSTLSVEELTSRLAEGENLLAEAQRRDRELTKEISQGTREQTQQIFRKKQKLYEGMQAYKRYVYENAPEWRPAFENKKSFALEKEMFSIAVGPKGTIYLSDLDRNAARLSGVLSLSLASDTTITLLSPEGAKKGQWQLADFWGRRVLPTESGEVFVIGIRQVLKLDAEGNELERVELTELLRRLDAPEGTAAASVEAGAEPEEEKSSLLSALGRSVMGGVREKIPMIPGEDSETASLEKQMIDGCVVGDDLFVAFERIPTQQNFMQPVTVRLLRTDRDFQQVTEIENDFTQLVGKGKYLAMDDAPVSKNLVVLRRDQPAVQRFNREGISENSWGKIDSGLSHQVSAGQSSFPTNPEQLPPPSQLNLMQGGQLRIDKQGKVYIFTRNPATVIRRFTSDGKFEAVIGFPSNKMEGPRTVDYAASPKGEKMYVLEVNPPKVHVYEER
jgi:hypothetical protein